MEGLKPCPFCGETTKLKVVENKHPKNIPSLYSIFCTNCCTRSGYKKNREYVISAWNKRIKEVQMLICGYMGCHVIESEATKNCDCTKCPSSVTGCSDRCESFMAKARRSAFFSEAAKKKCDMCLEVARKEFSNDK